VQSQGESKKQEIKFSYSIWNVLKEENLQYDPLKSYYDNKLNKRLIKNRDRMSSDKSDKIDLKSALIVVRFEGSVNNQYHPNVAYVLYFEEDADVIRTSATEMVAVIDYAFGFSDIQIMKRKAEEARVMGYLTHNINTPLLSVQPDLNYLKDQLRCNEYAKKSLDLVEAAIVGTSHLTRLSLFVAAEEIGLAIELYPQSQAGVAYTIIIEQEDFLRRCAETFEWVKNRCTGHDEDTQKALQLLGRDYDNWSHVSENEILKANLVEFTADAKSLMPFVYSASKITSEISIRPPDIKAVFYMILQESLFNAIKYAAISNPIVKVIVDVDRKAGDLLVRIGNNGASFENSGSSTRGGGVTRRRLGKFLNEKAAGKMGWIWTPVTPKSSELTAEVLFSIPIEI
jgi:signal transduction histidine kinase